MSQLMSTLHSKMEWQKGKMVIFSSPLELYYSITMCLNLFRGKAVLTSTHLINRLPSSLGIQESNRNTLNLPSKPTLPITLSLRYLGVCHLSMFMVTIGGS